MSIRQLFIASSLAVSCWLPAAAQSVPLVTSSLSLSQAMQAAQNNLDVSLARRALDVARGDVTAADRAPIAVLSSKAGSINLQNGIGEGNLFRDKRLEKVIGVDWTYERGNKRELRTQAAQSLADAAMADVEDIKVQQLIATAAAYFDVLAAQERINEVRAIARSAAQLASTAQRRVQAGDLPALDAARTEIEAQRAATDLASALIDRQRTALGLAQLTGISNPAALWVQADWPVLQSLPTDTLYPSIEARAEVRAALQRVEAARAALESTSAQKSRDLTLGTSFTHFPGTTTRQLEFRLQMPLNGFLGSYNFQGEIARAQAQLGQAEDTLEKTRRSATADFQRLQQNQSGAAARALSYEASILPRAHKVAEMAELAYSKGAMSLTELIDARRTLRSILIEALNARTDHAKAALAWQLRQP